MSTGGSAAGVNALYLHLRPDGGIFVVRADGREGWVTRARLLDLLREMDIRDGMVLYTTDPGEPVPIVAHLIEDVTNTGFPLRRLDQPHPSSGKAFVAGTTALMGFSHQGSLEMVGDLLARGAEVDARDDDGATALMYASAQGQIAVVEVLLRSGADPNARDADGTTPIALAAQADHLDVARRLVEAGADPNVRGDLGLTPLALARELGHAETASYLASIGATP